MTLCLFICRSPARTAGGRRFMPPGVVIFPSITIGVCRLRSVLSMRHSFRVSLSATTFAFTGFFNTDIITRVSKAPSSILSADEQQDVKFKPKQALQFPPTSEESDNQLESSCYRQYLSKFKLEHDSPEN